MRLLPIGIQDFTDIREGGVVYVDKTARVHQLITGSGKQFFLSRPRRFGKSLLCSTLGAIFEGRRELFGETKRFVYCFEFKLDKSAAEALAQIDTKDYLLPWNWSGKKLFKVGVDFNREQRNIGEWQYEAVEK
jgi:hypothetical protein